MADHIGVLGTIELLFPIMDTDGYNRKIHDLSSSHCLPRDDLEKLFKEAVSNTGEAVDILIAYDPKGTPQSYRPRFNFEADIYETEAPPPPMPPGDMKFGEAKWDPRLNQLLVTWYPPTDEWFEQFSRPDRSKLVEPSWTATELTAIEQYEALNSKCRGGSGDIPKTIVACDQRDAATERLLRLGICYGRTGEAGYQMAMHRCDAGSIQTQR